MLWVDHQNYFGPDRRRPHGGLRLRERRRYDYASHPPPLNNALRQLRMRVLEARGPGLRAFADRTQAVAALADMQHETEAAFILSSLAVSAAREREQDVRPQLYRELDRVHGALRTAH